MNIIILYATTEGQTRKIARHAQRHLVAAGHAAELLPARDTTDPELATYDAALLLASVHAGGFQQDIATLAHLHRTTLDAMPNAFVSVSLTAAGDDPEDWKGLTHVIGVFQEATGWTPARIEHVAGAFRFSHYNWLKNWAMRRIATQKDPAALAGGDTEYTDWPAFEAFLDDWVSAAQGAVGGPH